MKNYEITYADGGKETIQAESLFEACGHINRIAIKIENIDRKILLDNIRRCNDDFSRMGKLYWQPDTLKVAICNVLETHGFNSESTNEELNIRGEHGAFRCHPIGREVYLCVTWFRMESGNFEFVGYIS